MEYLIESWSLIVILLSAFLIGWAAETAQTFIPRALALSILAWLQTLPEFAVEAAIAWDQKRDLMIANLTGSLRLLVGLGWPMIFFVYWMTAIWREKRAPKEIVLEDGDYTGVIFLFISVLYFILIVAKGSLTIYDSVILSVIYFAYLIIAMRTPVEEHEGEEELPWVGKQIMKLGRFRAVGVTALFVLGGVALYLSVHPFLNTLQKWSLSFGISTFVFVQWVAPFLSEFPEKVSAFNWARQKNKAPMAVMNMVNSNINQWTMLAAMIPVVFSISLGHIEGISFDEMHRMELWLTIVQSLLGGLLLLDLRFSMIEAVFIFVLWLVQFIWGHQVVLEVNGHNWTTAELTIIAYLFWIAVELAKLVYLFLHHRQVPRAVTLTLNRLKKRT